MKGWYRNRGLRPFAYRKGRLPRASLSLPILLPFFPPPSPPLLSIAFVAIRSCFATARGRIHKCFRLISGWERFRGVVRQIAAWKEKKTRIQLVLPSSRLSADYSITLCRGRNRLPLWIYSSFFSRLIFFFFFKLRLNLASSKLINSLTNNNISV